MPDTIGHILLASNNKTSSGSIEKCVMAARGRSRENNPTGSLEKREIAVYANLADGKSPLHMLISSMDS